MSIYSIACVNQLYKHTQSFVRRRLAQCVGYCLLTQIVWVANDHHGIKFTNFIAVSLGVPTTVGVYHLKYIIVIDERLCKQKKDFLEYNV